MQLPRRAIRQAIALYESFRERRPRKIKVLQVDIPQVVACVGHVDYIGYTTTHGRKTQPYKHKFFPGSRPLLCVSADGRQLLLLGGRYVFDERGIVDKDHQGRDVINPAHGEDLTD